jgi:pimeloyl-ACP methyl ester carboxylesterase
MPECTTADGVRIAYDDVGSGPPIVFVHGITDNRTLWAPAVEALSPDHRCLALDLRGHGQSGDAADYSALALAQAVAAVVAAAGIGDAPPNLVGHSLGGCVFTVAAATAPAASVVNVDQPLRFSDFAAALAPLESMLRGPEFHETRALIFGSLAGDRLSPEWTARLRSHREHARQDVVLGVWNLVFSTPPDELDAISAQLGPAITAPYLALHGDTPAPGYADWLRALIPGGVIEEWNGDGHYLHLVEPDRFAARLRAFVG